MRNGYLGCSPLQPTIAISLWTLLAYRQIHRTCPWFSIEAMSKVLCYMHKVCNSFDRYDLVVLMRTRHKMPYHNYLRNQFMIAYDIYLDICQRVSKQIHTELGYDSASHLPRLCPPCFSTVSGEEKMDFSVLVLMDGNNSLKWIGPAIHGADELLDSHKVVLDRWLRPQEVDQFKYEVMASVSLRCNCSLSEISHHPYDREILTTSETRTVTLLVARPIPKSSNALTGGRTWALKQTSGHFLSSTKLVYLLCAAIIAWSYIHVILLKAVNCCHFQKCT
jgi:hypothetical protein